MALIAKRLTLIALGILVCVTSGFLIKESAELLQKIIGGSIWEARVFASIPEIYLILFTMLKSGKSNSKKKDKDRSYSILAAALFSCLIITSTVSVLLPIYEDYQAQQRYQDRVKQVEALYASQSAVITDSLAEVKGQKVNTILNRRAQQKLGQDKIDFAKQILAEAPKEPKTIWSVALMAFITIFIRVLLQSCNVKGAHFLGAEWKKTTTTAKSKKTREANKAKLKAKIKAMVEKRAKTIAENKVKKEQEAAVKSGKLHILPKKTEEDA